MDGQIATTSFIPKTRLTGPTYRRKGIGLSILISGFILLVSLGLFGGAYLYRQSLEKSVSGDIASLELAKKSLEPGLINDLNRLTFSIDAAKILFNQHNAASKIFDTVSKFTLKDMRFLNFDFNATGKNLFVKMTGEAKDYTSIALQAKLFEESGAASQIRFSNFALKEGGKVNFDVEITLNPLSLIYKP